MKSERQAMILEIVGDNEIENQEQLIRALSARGIHATQATISRDIREMRIVKETRPNGKHCFAVKAASDFQSVSRLNTIFRECVVKIDHAQNIVVIKTLPGLASAAGSAVDGMEFEYVVGTIAGDDTAMIIMRDNSCAQEFCDELRGIIGKVR